MMEFSILMPVYNERDTIVKSLERVRQVSISGIDMEIIVVDDCLNDGTGDILRKLNIPGVKIVYHEVNHGKGGAVRTALENATGEIVVIQDSDLEYDPMELPRLIEPIVKGDVKVVYGSRFLKKRGNRFFFAQWIANRFLTWLTNVLFGAKLTDMETCYKAIGKRLFLSLNIESERFEIEPEITTKLLKRGVKIKEIPISFEYRTYSKGKKINWKDRFQAMIFLVKARFTP